jgi:hypothetical protein
MLARGFGPACLQEARLPVLYVPPVGGGQSQIESSRPVQARKYHTHLASVFGHSAAEPRWAEQESLRLRLAGVALALCLPLQRITEYYQEQLGAHGCAWRRLVPMSDTARCTCKGTTVVSSRQCWTSQVGQGVMAAAWWNETRHRPLAIYRTSDRTRLHARLLNRCLAFRPVIHDVAVPSGPCASAPVRELVVRFRCSLHGCRGQRTLCHSSCTACAQLWRAGCLATCTNPRVPVVLRQPPRGGEWRAIKGRVAPKGELGIRAVPS